MSATVLYMSMSLDGFIAGPNEGPQLALAAGILDELERTRILEGEAGVTHMHYRVQR